MITDMISKGEENESGKTRPEGDASFLRGFIFSADMVKCF